MKMNFSNTVRVLCVTGALSAALPAAAAGNVVWALKGGGNWTNTSSVDSFGNAISTSYGTGWMAGLGMDYGMSPLGFMADVMYASRKTKENPGIGSLSMKFNSLYVPLQIRYRIGHLHLGVGGYIAYGLGTVSETISGVPGFADGTATSSYSDANISRTDYGAVASVGFAFNRLLIEARYNFGLANTDSPVVGSDSSKLRSIDADIGIRF